MTAIQPQITAALAWAPLIPPSPDVTSTCHARTHTHRDIYVGHNEKEARRGSRCTSTPDPSRPPATIRVILRFSQIRRERSDVVLLVGIKSRLHAVAVVSCLSRDDKVSVSDVYNQSPAYAVCSYAIKIQVGTW